MAALNVFLFIFELVFRFLPIFDTGIQIWNGIEVNNISNHGNNISLIFLSIISNHSGGFFYPEPLCCREPLSNVSIEKAKRLCHETNNSINSLWSLTNKTDWSASSPTIELERWMLNSTERLKKLRDAKSVLKKMEVSFDNCEEAAAGKTIKEMKPVNMVILQRNFQKTSGAFHELFEDFATLFNRRKRSTEGNDTIYNIQISSTEGNDTIFNIEISLEGAISLGLVQLPGVCLGLLGVFKAFQLHGLRTV